MAAATALLCLACLLFSTLVGVAIALLCCRLARPPDPPIVPPWMEPHAHDAGASKPAGSPTRGSAATDDAASGSSVPYDVWVHREVDALVSFPFGESIARELRRLGIDARVEPPPELDVPPNPNPNTPSRRPTLAQRPLRSEARLG